VNVAPPLKPIKDWKYSIPSLLQSELIRVGDRIWTPTGFGTLPFLLLLLLLCTFLFMARSTALITANGVKTANNEVFHDLGSCVAEVNNLAKHSTSTKRPNRIVIRPRDRIEAGYPPCAGPFLMDLVQVHNHLYVQFRYQYN